MNERLLSEQEINLYWSGTFQEINFGSLLAAQDAKSITARDKWWVDNMRLMFARCCESTCQYMTPVCSYLSNACMAWQSLKQPISPSGEGK